MSDLKISQMTPASSVTGSNYFPLVQSGINKRLNISILKDFINDYTVPVSRGGTGLTSLGSANQVLRVNSSGSALEYYSLPTVTSSISSLSDVALTSLSASQALVFDGSKWTNQVISASGGSSIYITPEDYGAVGDGTTDDTAAMQAALNAAIESNGGILVFQRNKEYRLLSEVVIENFSAGLSPIVTIEGNNSSIRTSGSFSAFHKKVIDQSDAMSQVTSRVIFKNIRFIGDYNSSGSKAIEINATYGSEIKNCSFQGFDTAIELRFCLNAIVEQNYFANNNVYDIYAGWGDWPGAGIVTSQSNQTVFKQNRHFAKAGQPVLVYIDQSSNMVVEDCIFEGANPIRNIYFNAEGNTTVKSFYLIRPHIENAPLSSSIYLFSAGTISTIDGYWAQLAHTWVESHQSSSGTVIFENPIYIAGSQTNVIAQQAPIVGATTWVMRMHSTIANNNNFDVWFNNMFRTGSGYAIPSTKYYNSQANKMNYMEAKAAYLGASSSIYVNNNNFFIDAPSTAFIRSTFTFDNAASILNFTGTSRLNFGSSTARLSLPRGTESSRPVVGGTVAGDIYFNSTRDVLQIRDNVSWYSLGKMPVNVVTASFVANEGVFLVSSSANMSASLNPVLIGTGSFSRPIVIKKIVSSSNIIPIVPITGLIDGLPSASISRFNESCVLVSDGINFFKISEYKEEVQSTDSNTPIVLTDAATVTWNYGLSKNASVTLGGNRTLSIISSSAGSYGTLIVNQDGGGNRTLSLPSGSKVINNGTGSIALSTGSNAIDIISFYYDGSTYYWNKGLNYT